ncbi:MAG: hypothetical protein N4A46_00975 [Schleiferiaceae bacterium]|jgi:hypothetical protein|nr:hypothetical protein [Schleiferiaceae bacterium]
MKTIGVLVGFFFSFFLLGQEASHQLVLSIPSQSQLRIVDPVGVNSGGSVVQMQSNTTIQQAGDQVENLFPFYSDTYFLQYTYVASSSAINGAKITIHRSAFSQPEFENETNLYVVIGSSNTYTSSGSNPSVNSNQKLPIPVSNSKSADLVSNIQSGWTGAGVGQGTSFSYEWDLASQSSSAELLAGKTESTQITYTLVEY